MSVLIIDASVALSWIYRDEASEESDALFARVAREGAAVPAIFHLEVANALLQGEKRGRLTPVYTAERLSVLSALRLSVDSASERVWVDTIAIARIDRLTAYDAAYLELTLRLGGELATFDTRLEDAARKRGLIVHARNPLLSL